MDASAVERTMWRPEITGIEHRFQYVSAWDLLKYAAKG